MLYFLTLYCGSKASTGRRWRRPRRNHLPPGHFVVSAGSSRFAMEIRHRLTAPVALPICHPSSSFVVLRHNSRCILLSFITPHGQPTHTHTHTTAYNHIHQHTQNYTLRSIKTQKRLKMNFMLKTCPYCIFHHIVTVLYCIQYTLILLKTALCLKTALFQSSYSSP